MSLVNSLIYGDNTVLLDSIRSKRCHY